MRSAKKVRISGVIGNKGRRVGRRKTRFYAFLRKKTGTKQQGLYIGRAAPDQTTLLSWEQYGGAKTIILMINRA